MKTPKLAPHREQVLLDRCRELNVRLDGQPPHVTAQLRAITDEEADAIQAVELEEHAEIERKYRRKLTQRIGRRITHAAIGRAFAAVPTSSTVEMSQPPAPTDQKGGVA
jgi:hypothetical protein